MVNILNRKLLRELLGAELRSVGLELRLPQRGHDTLEHPVGDALRVLRSLRGLFEEVRQRAARGERAGVAFGQLELALEASATLRGQLGHLRHSGHSAPPPILRFGPP